jgi:hypothetical protein
MTDSSGETGSPRRSAQIIPLQPYRPWWKIAENNRELRLDIREADGTSHLINYSLILHVQYTPPALLSLLCSHCAITLQGGELEKLKEGLQDENIRYIQVFNPKRFSPPEDGQVIESISIQWVKREMER